MSTKKVDRYILVCGDGIPWNGEIFTSLDEAKKCCENSADIIETCAEGREWEMSIEILKCELVAEVDINVAFNVNYKWRGTNNE